MEAGLPFYILLIVAVIAGFFLARLSSPSGKARGRTPRDIYDDYFVGLNYLLRDEPDEAVDTFIKGLEINGDTIETHLALGTLLRRRGKVDKAIKVHQELLARAGLSSEFADSVRLELSNDYIAAGLLDRAERLLQEQLTENNESRWDALLQLSTVYQIEKEWDRAIDAVRQLLQNPRYRRQHPLHSIAAHFCCELAQQAINRDHFQEARDNIKRAFQFDRSSARASFQLAVVERKAGNIHKAIKELCRIASLHPQLIPEVIEPLLACYRSLGDKADLRELRQFLESCLDQQAGPGALLALIQLTEQTQGREAAVALLTSRLNEKPSLRGIAAMLQLQAGLSEPTLQPRLQLAVDTINRFLDTRPGFRCGQCGFEARKLYWQCPSCQKWDQLKPIAGAEGG